MNRLGIVAAVFTAAVVVIGLDEAEPLKSIVDAGIVFDTGTCVRRAANSVDPSDCLRQVPGFEAADFGVLNRFTAEWAVGEHCEPVPCTVVAGQDADDTQ